MLIFVTAAGKPCVKVFSAFYALSTYLISAEIVACDKYIVVLVYLAIAVYVCAHFLVCGKITRFEIMTLYKYVVVLVYRTVVVNVAKNTADGSIDGGNYGCRLSGQKLAACQATLLLASVFADYPPTSSVTFCSNKNVAARGADLISSTGGRLAGSMSVRD